MNNTWICVLSMWQPYQHFRPTSSQAFGQLLTCYLFTVIPCHSYRQGAKQKEKFFIIPLRINLLLFLFVHINRSTSAEGICEGEIMHDQHDSLLCWEDWSGECCGNFLKTKKYSDSRLNIEMEKTSLIRSLWNWSQVSKNFLCEYSMICKYTPCLMELCYVWGYQPQRRVALQTLNLIFPRICQIILRSFCCWIYLEKTNGIKYFH